MTKVTLKGNAINTNADIPSVGDLIVDGILVKNDLSEVSLSDFKEKLKVLNIFPSLDTGTCAMSVRQFNKMAGELSDVKVLCISQDLPFAQKRFCGVEGIQNVETVSSFRSSFARDNGLEFIDGPLKGLCVRSVIILNNNNEVIYVQLVNETSHEPNYNAVMDAIKSNL